MDDGRLGGEMTLADIAKRLDAIQSDIGEVKTDLGGVKADLGGVKADLGDVKADLGDVREDLGGVKADLGDVREDLGGVKADLGGLKAIMARGFERVDEALNAAKVRDEEILGIAKLGLEAVEALDEKVDRRFADTDRAMADQKALMETAIRATARGR